MTTEIGVKRLTLTGHGKQKCLVSWNFSISKSLTPQSLFEAVKWTAPLRIKKETSKFPALEWMEPQPNHQNRKAPGAVINLNSIGDSIFIISCSGAKANSRSIQMLNFTHKVKRFSLKQSWKKKLTVFRSIWYAQHDCHK